MRDERRDATGRPGDDDGARRGFTLLEVLVAVAVLGLALVSLLGLHVRNLALIERDQRITEATLLARALMTEAEIEPFPELGILDGDFEERYPERYPELRWEREVLATPVPTSARFASGCSAARKSRATTSALVLRAAAMSLTRAYGAGERSPAAASGSRSSR